MIKMKKKMGKKCLEFSETLETAFKQVRLVFCTGQGEIQGHPTGLWVDTAQASWPARKCWYPAEDKRRGERVEVALQ